MEDRPSPADATPDQPTVGPADGGTPVRGGSPDARGGIPDSWYLPPDGYPAPPVHPQAAPPSLLKRLLAPFIAIGFFLLKFGKLALLALKGGKFAGTAITMIISIGAYSLFFGWPFAVIFVLLILVHEMGHVIQLRREGIDASAPMFIPFLGAAVAMREMPRNALVEARVGLAGPILGTAGGLVVYGLGLQFHSDLLIASAFTAFFINLFNLLPISPLDGGRAMAAVSPVMWLLGALGIGVMFFLSPNPILAIIAIFALYETWSRWRKRKETPEYYNIVTTNQRLAVFGTWLGLAIALGVLMDMSHIKV
ncbi:MAG: site-2 protease family protein [Thermoleophilia bacterium]|nr:site-2 protease family protein [Thermoleophilia bacterium]